MFSMVARFSAAQLTALNFDGVDDYLTVKSTSKLNSMTKITIETWIYVTNWYTSPCNNCAPIVWHQADAYRFGTGNNQKFYLSLMNGSSVVTLTSADTVGGYAWHHVAATFDGTKIRLYVDGNATDSASYSSFTISYNSTDDVWIADPKTGFGGTLEETRIWDYARTPAQIQEGMLKHYTGNETGLVMQLSYEDGIPYDDNTGVTTILDATSYNHDATPDYFTMLDSTSNFVIGRSYCDTPVYSSYSITRCTKYILPSKKRTVNASGVYQDTITSWEGCDSVMTITVTILKTSAANYNLTACDSVQNPTTKEYYKKSGKYTNIMKNYVGCDSVITVFATVLKKDTTRLSLDVCKSYTLGSGKVVTVSGNYTDSLTGYRGCDSFVLYDLKIRKETYAQATLTMCKFVLCPTDKSKIFRSPGIYYDTIPNSFGCDSIIEYTVKSRATSGVVNINSCGAYISPSKKYTWNTSGTYLDTLVNGNKAGCDSFMTINLTIEAAVNEQFSVTECGSYTVPSGKKVVTSTEIVTDVIKSQAGCDSIKYLINVTIVNVNTGYTRAGNVLTASTTNSGATFKWLDCNASYAAIPGATNKSFSPAGDGRFALAVTENSCTDTSNCANFAFNSRKDMVLDDIVIFPNPTSGGFSLGTDRTLHHVRISVYNSVGELITSWTSAETAGARFEVNLAPSLYIIKVESDEGSALKYVVFE